MEQPLEVMTFGMFIIDEIQYVSGKSPERSLIGGAGTYVAVGARLVAGGANARLIGWIVDKGSDFPEEFEETINSWGTSVTYRTDSTRLTTRGWNGYGQGEHRDFKYLTPKVRLDENSLSDRQLEANAFHMVCSPMRCVSLVSGIALKRSLKGFLSSKPRIVWEPVPELCTPGELKNFKNTVKVVDVVSPNAEELAGFFASGTVLISQSCMADRILGWGIGLDGTGTLVVREGSNGCSVYTRTWSCHLPAYHSLESSFKVKDPTGGGNAFLGGLAMGLSRTVNPQMAWVELELDAVMEPLRDFDTSASTLLSALIYASVASSYVIEQTGMPALSTKGSVDMWNGESFADRITQYVRREGKQIGRNLQIRK